MSRIIIFSAVFIVIGLIVGLNLQGPQLEPLAAPLPDNNSHQIAALRDANTLLQARLTTLETRQAQQQTTLLALQSTIDLLRKQVKRSAELSAGAVAPHSGTTARKAPPPVSSNAFVDQKSQALAALGIDESITERIAQRREKREMENLYLRNTAIREGWFGTEKYFEKRQELNQTANVYREELGNEDYDRFLYNTNQNNRIRILSVISDSPADHAGLAQGDIIKSYDQEPVFSWSELTQATTAGELNQDVSIVIRRNGTEMALIVPRGPLGIRLESIRVDPDAE
ncbi:MAG TPA: PDZ domain-containing protein [Gammaproteobacteria bacterium]|nr:PDZ domain-containing protein [Gammaproteobacteria bacterium]